MRIVLVMLCLHCLCACHKPKTVSVSHSLKADSILLFAQSLLGSPYQFTGTTPKGFDCSGYTHYVFRQFGIELPHSSAEQMKVGETIAICEAAKGDIVLFTGTDKNKREPGHVGIVLKNDTCQLYFIHASSNGGVKINQVKDGYMERFLAIKRLDY
jgi:cell wall-associated NlpC family hydrolase